MKKLITFVVALFMTTTIFAQSATFSAYLKKAKDYEAKKQWVFALDAYYDALSCNEEPQIIEQAYTAYNNLRTAIALGNPGLGKYNAFTMHDEWKKLLIDAEKLGSSMCTYDISVGNLVQGKLDYETRTATYYSKINVFRSNRYNNTIQIIANGYKNAYKTDWTDLVKPEKWPLYSVSHSKAGVYNENGALLLEKDGSYFNAFYVLMSQYIDYSALYDFKFNIVDKSGKEIVKGKRWLCGTEDFTITFTGIKPDVMDLIDNEQAFVNLQTVYLEYGRYNKDDDLGGRTFIKNFPEVELGANKVLVKDANNANFAISNFDKTNINFILNDYFTTIPGKTFKTGKTEVTQTLYEAVMGENPSINKGGNLPVENVSWYDAIYFCNKLSVISGKQPVYAVRGSTDINSWNYTPHYKSKIGEKEITQNLQADGYRLPTGTEWEYAARGGEFSAYSGSNNLDEVAWNYNNSANKTHPVAQKKANAFGLYDMSGNVDEFIWGLTDNWYVECSCRGGDYTDNTATHFDVTYNSNAYAHSQMQNVGLRLFASLTGDELAAAQKEIEAKNTAIINDFDKSLITIPYKTYKITKTEVRQDLYEAVMGENPCSFKLGCLPVENISWYDAIYFCNKLSVLKGKKPVYAVDDQTDVAKWDYTPHKQNSIRANITQNELANGYRLPSKEEWETAARGGDFSAYSGSDNLDDIAWYNKNSENKTHPAGQKKGNAFGLYDMTGNVCEYVWNNNYGNYKGGSYREDYSEYYKISNTNGNYANNRYNYIGLRLCATLEADELAAVKNQMEAKGKRLLDKLDSSFVKIPYQTYKVSQTEVTQDLYEAVMGENPAEFKLDNLPIEHVSVYDAIYFCNKLSIMKGKEPVYAINGKTDVKEWNYIPHQSRSIGETVTQNEQANGYRLLTGSEWLTAARGGEFLKYSGSDDLDEVAWYEGNSANTIHPVGKKKANKYGLYDMAGNVSEWVTFQNKHGARGLSYTDDKGSPYQIAYQPSVNYYAQYKDMGIRLAVSLTGDELEAAKKEVETRNQLIIEGVDNSFVQIPGQSFKMATTEVTQKLYEAVMGENPCYFKFEDLPAECVGWYEALYFCNKLSVMTGKEPVYAVDGKTDVTQWNFKPHNKDRIRGTITQNTQANGYRLPTAEEWEYAARGGQTYNYAGSDNIDEVAWYDKNSSNRTHPVGQKKANGYGLYDMCGNVREWIWGEYKDNDGDRHNCGGGWENDYYSCKVGDKTRTYGASKDNAIGLRLVISAE